MKQLKVGSKIQWKWLGGLVDGRVERVYTKPVVRVIKGKAIKRNGSKDKPAYLVKSTAGALALKLQTELSLKPKKKPRQTIEPVAHEFTERDVIQDLNEDFRDAFMKLRELAVTFGEQRIYASAHAVMFARRVCYMFVRPKTKYMEFVFFLPHELDSPAVFRVEERSPTKFAHTVRLVHGDQIEEPLTDWIREAFEAAE